MIRKVSPQPTLRSTTPGAAFQPTSFAIFAIIFIMPWIPISQGWILVLSTALPIALILSVVVIEMQPALSLGLRKTPIKDAILLGACIAIVALFNIATAHSHEVYDVYETRFVYWIPVQLRIADAITQPIMEELAFRGYLYERILPLLRNPILAVVSTQCVFGFTHISRYGLQDAASISIQTLPFVLLYAWRRNVYLTIAMHIAWDLMAFVVLPLLHPGYFYSN